MSELDLLQNEVKEINDKIITLCKENKELDILYKGCQIYYSPFVKNPDLMIIGINPGDGYYRQHNKIVQKFEPVSDYEDLGSMTNYLDNLFIKLGKQETFLNSFVTNTCFFSTHDEKSLDDLLYKLPKELSIEIRQKSIKWIKEMIAIISPKLILCSASRSFDFLRDNFKDNFVLIQNKGTVFEGKINNIPIVGYNRRCKKELLIEKLKEYLL
jgi:hypothetical protein